MASHERQLNKETILTIPAGIKADLTPVAKEVHRLHESALYSAQGQFEQTKLWRLLNMVLGVPAAALAAVAGGTGLAANHRVGYAAVLALIAAAFSASLTTLNPSRRITQAQAAANAYLGIQTDARQLLTIDLLTLDYNEARDHLNELTARRDEVNQTADPPGRIARRRASQVIRVGGQAYEIDKSNSDKN
jgi:hypothetical protein